MKRRRFNTEDNNGLFNYDSLLMTSMSSSSKLHYPNIQINNSKSIQSDFESVKRRGSIKIWSNETVSSNILLPDYIKKSWFKKHPKHSSKHVIFKLLPDEDETPKVDSKNQSNRNLKTRNCKSVNSISDAIYQTFKSRKRVFYGINYKWNLKDKEQKDVRRESESSDNKSKDLSQFYQDNKQLSHKEDLIVISKFSLEETTSNDSYKNLSKITNKLK